MQTRMLGSSGLEVSALGLGCMGIALAWLLAQKPWIVPIPGTTKLHRLDENLGAAAVELTPGELREIRSAAAEIMVHGARYSESSQRMIDR